MSQPWRIAATLAATTLAAACHASGGHGVSATDHGVTVTVRRPTTSTSTVELTIKNGSAQSVCLGSASFLPQSFAVKTDQGIAESVAPPVPVTADCDTLAAGAEKTQTVDAGKGFSRLQMQTGRLCYRYAFSGSAPGAAPWQGAGMVCE